MIGEAKLAWKGEQRKRRRFEMKRFGLVVVLLGFTLATPARAGVVDSPLPAPFTQHVFTVPGVVTPGGLDAFFTCTNLDAVNVTIGVEIFGSPGGAAINDAADTSLNVATGATVMFGTGAAVGLVIDSNLGSGNFSKGSARILSTSKKIACTAFVADPSNAPPTSAWQLTIIAKTKQKAAN
jgi:hypothetical protein